MPSTPKAIVLDIDHSLIHPEAAEHLITGPPLYLHPTTRKIVADLQRRGILLVLATGRKIPTCHPNPFPGLIEPDWTLAEHGGLLLDRSGELDQPWYDELAPWIGHRRDQHAQRSGCLWDFWRELHNEGFAFDSAGLASFSVDLNVPQPSHQAVIGLPQRNPPSGVNAKFTRFNSLDVFPAQVNKGWAIRRLVSDRLGIPLEHTAAVGDDLADQELLEVVGLPCTFPNAHHTCVTAVTDRHGYIAGQKQHAGIIEILQHLLNL